MASDKQINYIHGLADKKDLRTLDVYIMAQINTEAFLEAADNAQVNIILDALKALPWKPRETEPTQSPFPNIPIVTHASELAELEAKVGKGHYFIVDPTDNTEKFFKVEKPEPPSRWSGHTFIKVQASDFFYPIKDNAHKVAILKTIAADPVTAMNEYGIRLGVCGYCGRTLTARDSRLRGMGPICAARITGAPTDEQRDLLKKLGLI